VPAAVTAVWQSFVVVADVACYGTPVAVVVVICRLIRR